MDNQSVTNAIEQSHAEVNGPQVRELDELQLLLVGGGIADVAPF